MSRLRLAAACALLKLAQEPCYHEIITLEQYQLCALVINVRASIEPSCFVKIIILPRLLIVFNTFFSFAIWKTLLKSITRKEFDAAFQDLDK